MNIEEVKEEILSLAKYFREKEQKANSEYIKYSNNDDILNLAKMMEREFCCTEIKEKLLNLLVEI